MKTLVNFANNKFKKKQRWNSITGKIIGGFDQVIEYSFKDLDEKFVKKNKLILAQEKGAGLWLWKPYIILKTLNEVKNNDIIFYCDSGSVFIKSFKPIFKILENSQNDIMCFEFPLIEKQWTKRDTFLLMNCDLEKFANTPQIMGGFLLIKKTKRSLDFMKQYLKYSEDYRIISESENVLGKENYDNFIKHRHDQSILSLLCKQNNVLIYNDITNYGVFPKNHIHSKSYLFEKKLINTKFKERGFILLNRKENPVIYFIKYVIKRFLKIINLY